MKINPSKTVETKAAIIILTDLFGSLILQYFSWTRCKWYQTIYSISMCWKRFDFCNESMRRTLKSIKMKWSWYFEWISCDTPWFCLSTIGFRSWFKLLFNILIKLFNRYTISVFANLRPMFFSQDYNLFISRVNQLFSVKIKRQLFRERLF